MYEDILTLLGDRADNYNDALIRLAIATAKAEIESYCNRKVDGDIELMLCCEQMAIIHLNRQNTEGLLSESYSGVSESYIDGFPSNILMVLNRKRKLKLL